MRRFASFDGTEIAYDVLGSGPAVLLHHGFASDSRTNWVRPGVADAVATSRRAAILVDARGHGESQKPHDPAAYEDGAMAHDVRALLDHLGVESVHFIGYSMGSFVGITLAATEPAGGPLRSLVLGGAGLGQLSPRNQELMMAIAEALETEERAAITDPTATAFRNFADATKADRLALAAIQRCPTARPEVAAIAKVSVPTLVVNGEADTMAVPSRSLAEAIAGARFVAVPGDHLSAVVQPEFKRVLLGWLDEVAPVSG
jgi:pimeloyl-ACP methyl ester carboxylesterase